MRLPRHPILWLGIIVVLCALAAACGPVPATAPQKVCSATFAVRVDTVWNPEHTLRAVVYQCQR